MATDSIKEVNDIPINEETCEYGHYASDGAASVAPLGVTDMMRLMQEQTKQIFLQQQAMQKHMEQQMPLLEISHKREKELKEALLLANSNYNAGNAQRPKRPLLEYGAKDHEWEVFLDSWERYKEVAKLSNISDIRYELRQSCSNEINQILLGFIGRDKLNSVSEEELLKYIKSVAIVVVHREVHRQNFGKLDQAEGESITHYMARLKSQAMLCEFTVDNPERLTEVSFAVIMIGTQTIAGLHNKEHQASVLRDTVSLSSSKGTFEKLLTLETTDKSTPYLGVRSPSHTTPGGTSSAAMKSQYQRDKFNKSGMKSDENRDKHNQESKKCRGCGQSKHPGGKPLMRNHCPAEGQICSNCGLKNHFAIACERKRRSSSRNNSQKYDGDNRDEDDQSNHGSSQLGSISQSQSTSFLHTYTSLEEEPLF